MGGYVRDTRSVVQGVSGGSSVTLTPYGIESGATPTTELDSKCHCQFPTSESHSSPYTKDR